MKCSKGNHYILNNKWETGQTYEGLDRHHNPPEFMFRGEVPKGKYWNGEMLSLCRKHHVELHAKIKRILFKHSNLSKFVNSEHWLCQHITDNQLIKAKEEVYNFTKEWIKEDDTSTT